MRNICFVITPIGQPDSPQRRRADRLCDQILTLALQECDPKLEIIRGDRVQESGPITVQLVECITDAKLIVADLVDPNPNVYYELGIAESFHKPIIRFGGGTAEALPFDVRDMRTIPLPKRDDGGIDIVDAMRSIESVKLLLPSLLAPKHKPTSIISLAERQAKFNSLTDDVAKDEGKQALLLRELASQINEIKQDIHSLKLDKQEVGEKSQQSISLGRGSAVIERYLGDFISLDAIEKSLKDHPNSPGINNLELQKKADGSLVIVIHGGYIHQTDYSEMSHFWSEFAAKMSKIGLTVTHSQD